MDLEGMLGEEWVWGGTTAHKLQAQICEAYPKYLLYYFWWWQEGFKFTLFGYCDLHLCEAELPTSDKIKLC